MEKIVILTPRPFLKRDYYRFGIDILKRSFVVLVFDCTALINQDYWKTISQNIFKFNEYISIKSKEDFLKSISKINSPIVIDRLPISKKANWMRKMLREKESKFVDLYLNVIPRPKKNAKNILLKIFIIMFNPKKAIKIIKNFLQRKEYNLIKSNFDISLVGGLASYNKFTNKNIINAHSMDYDVYLNIKDKPKNNSNFYAVFLDEDMVDHPDYAFEDQKSPVTNKQYNKTLSNFLKKFESETGFKVKIACHPKRKIENIPNLLKDFEWVHGETAKLVMNSRVTLVHQSTSLSYAILFKKPLIFLISNELAKSWLGPSIEIFSEILNSLLINMDNFSNKAFDTKTFLKIDEKKYKNYLDNYIKVPNSPDLPIWEIFAKEIKNNKYYQI